MSEMHQMEEKALARRQLAALVRCGAPPGPPVTGPWGTSLDSAMPGAAAVDWEVLLAMAQAERMDALLYAALLAARRLEMTPRPVRLRLKEAQWRTKVANLLALDAVAQMVGALEAVGVQVVVLKGAALAFGLYCDPARRPLGDIDILVAPGQAAKALRVLGYLGYEVAGATGSVETAPGGAGAHIAGGLPRGIPREGAGVDEVGWRSEVTLLRTGRGAVEPPAQVDLHWGWSARAQVRKGIAGQWFWEHTEALAVGGGVKPLRVLAPEAQLLHLCAHSLAHGTPRLRWTYDLALLLARRTLDWEVVLAAAGNFGLGLALQGNLAAVYVLWGVAPPESVRARLARMPVGAGEARTWRVACSGDARARAAWDLASLAQAGAVGALLNAWLAAALPDPEYMCWRYGVADRRVLAGLYLYRALWGSVRGGWGLARRWQG